MPNRILIEDVSIYSDLPNEYRDVVELWLLRLLLRLGLHTHFNSEQRFIDDSIRACLQLANAPETKHDPDRFYRAMVARLEELEKCPPSLPGNMTIAHQLRWFASTVGIEGTALDILHFTLMSKRIDPLEKALDALGLMQEKDIVRICAVTLGHSLRDVNDAFIEDGAMTKSGILWMNPDGACLFSHKVHMPDEIGARLGTEYDDPMHLFRGIVAPGKPASLTLADYPYHEFNQRLVQSHLRLARRWSATQFAFPLDAVIMIPPVIYTRGDSAGRPLNNSIDEVCQFMPSVLTMALFDSDPIKSEHMFSSALFLWYQDRWGLPPTRIQKALGDCEWETHAVDWSL